MVRTCLRMVVVALLVLIPTSGVARSPLADSIDVQIGTSGTKESSVFISPLDPNVILAVAGGIDTIKPDRSAPVVNSPG